MHSLESQWNREEKAIREGWTPAYQSNEPEELRLPITKAAVKLIYSLASSKIDFEPRDETTMNLPDFKIELLEGGRMPTKANPSDAGWDCYAAKGAYLTHGRFELINLGFKLEIPEGWEVQLRGRSGLATKSVVSHFGTIDHLYRKELKAMLTFIKLGVISESFVLKEGDKVCQMVFCPVYNNKLVQVNKVVETDRGGFGSTGR